MELFSSAAISLESAGRAVAEVAHRVARGVPSLQSAVRDTVELTVASGVSRAGAAVIRTANEVLGTIVDLFA
jgi:hypothetical protein